MAKGGVEMALKEIAKTGDITEGTMKRIEIENNEVLLARVGGQFYAIDSRCPHMGGDLSQGKLQGTVVTCPRHSSQFDLKDGHVVRWLKGAGLLSAVGKLMKSPRPIRTYKVEVRDDSLLVEI
jgi:3-phenylpropionate/trans-cinnamate dioxygenase ferredoxin subunit